MKIFSLHSIRSRLIVASLLLLPLVCGLLAWSLDKAYSSSLVNGQQRQMMLQAYALIAAAEIETSTLWLPEQMTDDRLNQLSSDTFAIVVSESFDTAGVLWQSLSASDKLIGSIWQGQVLTTGQSEFSTLSIGLDEYFVLQYAVEWEGSSGQIFPFQFVVFENRSNSNQQLFEYRRTLWWWLGGIALLLMVLQLVILRWGLRPIRGVIDDLFAVQQGQSDNLKGRYPEELTVMTDSINQLIQHQANQRERYRHTLADLAHSIKNPVAIIASVLEGANGDAKQKGLDEQTLINEVAEQNQRINQIVSYQLNRAVGGSSAPFNKAIQVKPVCEKIVSALKKLYVDKSMLVAINIEEEANFRGDEGDLMELLGNLIDNAFKYGEQKINISAKGNAAGLWLAIEDNGPGMTANEKLQLVQRGERADTAMPGQGIGLAVVSDITANYRGELILEKSTLGGLKVLLSFNWKWQAR
jgi:two-component system sensor histidine kinase PhoQ